MMERLKRRWHGVDTWEGAALVVSLLWMCVCVCVGLSGRRAAGRRYKPSNGLTCTHSVRETQLQHTHTEKPRRPTLRCVWLAACVCLCRCVDVRGRCSEGALPRPRVTDPHNTHTHTQAEWSVRPSHPVSLCSETKIAPFVLMGGRPTTPTYPPVQGAMPVSQQTPSDTARVMCTSRLSVRPSVSVWAVSLVTSRTVPPSHGSCPPAAPRPSRPSCRSAGRTTRK